MIKIKNGNELVAVLHRIEDWKEGLDFITPDETFIQAGTWWYDKGRSLRAHKHKLYDRNVRQTQETIVILSGKLRIDFYDDNNNVFQQQELKAGDLCAILNVGHGYEILEDNTKVIEIKNGPFISVEKDKELI